MVSHIRCYFPSLPWQNNFKLSGGKRPDCIVELSDRVIVVENDEKSHQAYNTDNESQREDEICDSFSKPIFMIRFNPDHYTDKDNTMHCSSIFKNESTGNYLSTPEWIRRLEVLFDTINTCIKCDILDRKNVIYLFYTKSKVKYSTISEIQKPTKEEIAEIIEMGIEKLENKHILWYLDTWIDGLISNCDVLPVEEIKSILREFEGHKQYAENIPKSILKKIDIVRKRIGEKDEIENIFITNPLTKRKIIYGGKKHIEIVKKNGKFLDPLNDEFLQIAQTKLLNGEVTREFVDKKIKEFMTNL